MILKKDFSSCTIDLNQKHLQKEENSVMNDFIKNIASALFNLEKINDLFRLEVEQIVNILY
ncbi:hypothetical protein FOD82_00125 [Lactobacillus sp. LL6]|nr:hypothetical protein FOD82_00125 [Lactobacillus sp. LL6]